MTRWCSLMLLVGSQLACAPARTGAPPRNATEASDEPGPSTAPTTVETASPASRLIPEWVRERLPELELMGADRALPLVASEHVVVSKNEILVDGKRVGSVPAVEAEGKLRRIDGLFEHLKEVRERFLAEHPGEPFSGSVTYWIDARVSALVTKSVFQTCAFAGFPDGHFVVLKRGEDGGHGQLPAEARVPGPATPGKPTGRLPPEVIQGEIRRSYARLRACYEQGLREDPELMGLVKTRFVIGRDGGVSNVGDAGSTLPNRRVIECVFGEFGKLRFPAPDGGIVTVVYPIRFSPE